MVKLIIDTDIGCDCDDAGALAVAHALCKIGEAELLAVTHCCAGEIPCRAIDAINRFYGNAVPVGGHYEKPGLYKNFTEGYTRKISLEFYNDVAKEDAITLLRKTLCNQEDNSVTLVVIGSFYNMQLLLNSCADNICPYDGITLIEKKIAKTVVMAGRFKQFWPNLYVLENGMDVDAEFNVVANIPAAIEVCERWKGELIFVSYELGFHIKTGSNLLGKGGENPVAKAYELFCNSPRESWDLIAVHYAIRPNSGFWRPYKKGQITVTQDGVTMFREDGSKNHSFLVENTDDNIILNELDSLCADAYSRRTKNCQRSYI